MTLLDKLNYWELLLRAPDGEGGSADTPPTEVPADGGDPPVETVVDPVSTGAAADGDTPPAGDPPAGDPPAGDPPIDAKTTPAWVMPRIAKLTARVRELEAAGNQPPQAPTGTPPAGSEPTVRTTDGRTLTETQLRQEIERAAQMTQLNTDLTKMVEKGNAAFPDFQQSIATLRDGVGIMTQPFLEAVLEAGQGGAEEQAKILQSLAKDPDQAARIAALPPIKQAVALAKFADGIKNAPQISRAPAPIGAPKVKGSAQVAKTLDDPDLPMEEFMAKRDAHEKQMRANGRWR